MDMSSPAVAHHLRLLKVAGLVTSRRVGKEVFYRAADTELVRAMHRMIGIGLQNRNFESL